MKDFTGIDSPYERPVDAEICIEDGDETNSSTEAHVPRLLLLFLR
ncbi:hypothetical protein [Diaphorobacter sp. HDW4A]